MNQYQDVIEQLKKRNPQAIIVFGSYAWGKPHKDSDIDLLVVEHSTKSRLDRMRELRSSIDTRMAVDVVALTPVEFQSLSKKNSFYKQIAIEGKVVYGRI